MNSNAAHRVSKISELTRLVATQVILISKRSAVNFACACRHLEEPVLSTLWETQWSLYTLLEVLPEEIWHCHRRGLYADCEVRGLIGVPLKI